MISKNSFWVDMKENNKRRIWLWSISWLLFLLYYVAGCALAIISAHNNLNGAELSRQLDDQEKWQALIKAVFTFLGSNTFLFVVASVLAVISAIQGFSYLYNRRQVDLYHSLPVKKSRRFAVIWLNGILIYLIPSLTGILGGILVAVTQGLMNADILNTLCVTYAVTLLLYISLYNLTIIAVMLTGHVIITVFAIVVFQAYEFGLRLLMRMYMVSFFDKYPAYRLGRDMRQMWLSPYWIYWEKVNWDRISWAAVATPLGSLFILAILFLMIGYLLYQKRPSEAAGRAMTFAVTKPVVKVALVVPVTLAAAILIKDMTSGYGYHAASGSPWFIAFTILTASVIGCALIEVIYEFDIKACLSRKQYILISGGLAALIYLGFRYDVMQYDDYVPDPGEVKNYAVILGNESWYFDENYDIQNAHDFVADNMFLTDAEAVCRLAGIQPEAYRNMADTGPGMENESDVDQVCQVIYRLDNGREVERNIWIDHDNPETGEILNRIVSSPEYKKGAFMVTADYFDNWLTDSGEGVASVHYKLGAYSHTVPEAEIGRLMEAYRRDLEFINYTDMNETLMAGTLEITKEYVHDGSQYQSSSRSYYYDMNIYADCVQTIACLKDLGLYRDTVIDPEDVTQIEVTNYNYDIADNHSDFMYDGTGYYAGIFYPAAIESESRNKYHVTARFDTADEIGAISQAIFPTQFYYGIWHEKLFDESYRVTVFFKPESDPYQMGITNEDYLVLNGQMPEFVWEETKYAE